MKAAFAPGTTFARYRVDALVGRGGMGVVYRAPDVSLERPVALKLIAPELAEDESFRARFLREPRLAASLDHPNVIPIYEAGEHDGQLYLAMRFVEGRDLKSVLEREDRMAPERALNVLGQVAGALDAAQPGDALRGGLTWRECLSMREASRRNASRRGVVFTVVYRPAPRAETGPAEALRDRPRGVVGAKGGHMLRRSNILTVAALALCCALAPVAGADPFTDSERKLVDEYNDQQSLGAPHSGPGPFTDSERELVESPQVQGMVDSVRSEVRETPAVVEVQAPSGGFDWGDAGIGAAGMLALFCIGGGSALLIAGRKRRHGFRAATH